MGHKKNLWYGILVSFTRSHRVDHFHKPGVPAHHEVVPEIWTGC